MKIPSREECMRLLRERIPKEQEIIIKHSLQVTNVALYLGKKLIEKGEKIDMDVWNELACFMILPSGKK